MNLSSDTLRELSDALHGLREDRLVDTQKHFLADLLGRSVEARQLYLEHLVLSAELRWLHDKTDAAAPVDAIQTEPSIPLVDQRQTNLRQHLKLSSFLGIAASLLLVGYFATIVGLLAWDRFHRANDHEQIAAQPTALAPALLTHADDASWKTPTEADAKQESTAQTLQVRSGLAELKFERGASVVVEGPAEFEVSSSNAGYLHHGKLVAQVPHQAIGFTIETPTVKVVDLGTEFGVEVDEAGATKAHVFRGAVKVQRASPVDSAHEEQAVVVRENESVRIEKSQPSGPQGITVIKDEEAGQFVRSLPSQKKPLTLLVLAHFRMGEDDAGAVAGQPAREQATNHGRPRHLKRFGSPNYVSDAAPGSALAMSFTGAPGEYLFRPDFHADYVDDFILEAWARPNRAQSHSALILYKGCGFTDGYGIGLTGSEWSVPKVGSFGGGWSNTQIECDFGKWTHLALVLEHGALQFWVNGQLAKDFGKEGSIQMPSGALSIGERPESIGDTPNGFDGQIDEVRLSKFRAPFDPKMLLFHILPEERN